MVRSAKRVATGVEQRGGSLRLIIKWKGEVVTETSPGACDARHIRQVVKRREWLLSRLRVGLPIHEEAEQLLGQIYADWIRTLDAKRSSMRSAENIWKNYWAQWNELAPQAITTAGIRQVLMERDISPKTRKNVLGVLSAVLTHGEVYPNPCASIRIKRGQKAPVARYSLSEVDALLNKLSGEAKVYFTVMVATGMRPGEILALQWSDWDGERLDVSKQIVRRRLTNSTKTSVRRRVFVPSWARSVLNGHTTRFKGGHVFQNENGQHHKDTDKFNLAWKRAHEKARVPYRIPYTLRHTRAAELLSQGCNAALAARELGHSVEMFLRVYSEFMQEYSEQEISQLEGARETKARDDMGGRRQ